MLYWLIHDTCVLVKLCPWPNFNPITRQYLVSNHLQPWHKPTLEQFHQDSSYPPKERLWATVPRPQMCKEKNGCCISMETAVVSITIRDPLHFPIIQMWEYCLYRQQTNLGMKLKPKNFSGWGQGGFQWFPHCLDCFGGIESQVPLKAFNHPLSVVRNPLMFSVHDFRTTLE